MNKKYISLILLLVNNHLNYWKFYRIVACLFRSLELICLGELLAVGGMLFISRANMVLCLEKYSSSKKMKTWATRIVNWNAGIIVLVLPILLEILLPAARSGAGRQFLHKVNGMTSIHGKYTFLNPEVSLFLNADVWLHTRQKISSPLERKQCFIIHSVMIFVCISLQKWSCGGGWLL